MERDGADFIDVWLAADSADAAALARMHALLGDDERARETRFHFATDRARYRVTRALVRTVLSRYAPLAPAQWRFVANRWGRPAPAPQHGALLDGLCFNVSHTRGLVALAVSRHRALGVDVEDAAARAVSPGLAERFFAAAEVRALAGVADERRQRRFFEYWTLKEAYVKARGMGLSLPLDQFAFELADGAAPRLVLDPALDDHAGRWWFTQHRLGAHHLLALCAELRGGSAPPVTLRQAPGFGAVAAPDLQAGCNSVRSK